MLFGEQVRLEQRLGFRNHGTDRCQHLTERHLVESEAALGSLRRGRELALFRIEQEQIRHRPRHGDAAVEDRRGIGSLILIQCVAAGDGAMQAFWQVPGAHEPAADLGVIGLQAQPLEFRERPVIALPAIAAAVQIRQCLVERQDAHILQQGG